MRALHVLAAAALACLTACASDPDDHQERGERGPPQPRASLFISPAGKPFHAPPGAPYPVAVWFGEADLDHDGRLSRLEFRADFAAFFRRLDANNDGVIDGFELADYEEKVAPEILPRIARVTARSSEDRPVAGPPRASGGSPGGRRGGGAEGRSSIASFDGAPAFSLLNISEPVASADTDLNGRITLAAFLAAADRRFDLLDVAHLGYLTLPTLPRTEDQIAIEGKKPPVR